MFTSGLLNKPELCVPRGWPKVVSRTCRDANLSCEARCGGSVLLPANFVVQVVTPFSMLSGCAQGIISIFWWGVINMQAGETYSQVFAIVVQGQRSSCMLMCDVWSLARPRLRQL